MILKKRDKPKALSVMESLSIRSKLSATDKQYYQHQVKGYEGEVAFDSLIDSKLTQCIILNDLVLKINGTIFQIDSLVVTSQKIYVYEVKNYEGEYQYKKNQFRICHSNSEILDPAVQVQRATVLLKQIMKQMRCDMECEPYVVFINTKCMVYMPEPTKHILFRSLLDQHVKSVNEQCRKLNERHYDFAKALYGKHIVSRPFTDFPDYSYESLKKGIYCQKCQKFIDKLSGRMCICPSCGHRESAYDNARRHVKEYRLLFPERKTATRELYNWCNGAHSTYRFRTILKQEKTIGMAE